MYSTRELATLLGVAPATVAKWRRTPDGGGPKWIKLNSKLVRYRTEDVQEWLAEQEQEENK
jgi:predicted DNA-binding transcriptional regulator AlpA